MGAGSKRRTSCRLGHCLGLSCRLALPEGIYRSQFLLENVAVEKPTRVKRLVLRRGRGTAVASASKHWVRLQLPVISQA